MDNYITGSAIKRLREDQRLTQLELAAVLGVSDKTISKWETAKGLPDITLIEPLAEALNISVIELLSGDYIVNQNKSSNMLRSKFYVCPVCHNVIHSTGEALVSCCGITLPVSEAEDTDEAHHMQLERVEDEYFITISHDMTKEHYISFLAYVTSDKLELIKLYAEGNAEGRFLIQGHGMIYCYCNRHGLMRQKV
ncbi:helix-turn-helix domain-containing protein [Anaerolentibacter hominis]|uniref:helix-turn-helix domain-containing protein n=1 Tax=Anaerolentibacter hominis TaxID=3079009 RepID=UPI0031B81A77